MSSFRAGAIPWCVSALIAAAALTGCASSRLSAQAPPGVHLAGDWKLDTARSDDLGKAVDTLHAQIAKARHDAAGSHQEEWGSYSGHRRTGGGQAGGQQGGDSGQDVTASGAEGVGPGAAGPMPRGSPVDELMASVPRGDYLRITVTPSAFSVMSGDASDEYTPGLESDISAEQGDAQQISGWKKTDYVIDTKPQWGPEIIQSYGLTTDGRLALTVRLTGSGTNITFTRVYDRTTSVAPLAPPTIN
ncbi:MAG TPA: hypothetical protein VGR92_10565 [Steroidobacteraceae bacterium]|nr:hypothetical protein [Steroidobacteraceae bacterium]